MPAYIAKIAVSAATYHIDKLYDYLIPDDLTCKVSPGMRVVVPFGRSNKNIEGVVLSLDSADSFDKLKSILSIVDDDFIFSRENIKLALWMHERFFCTVYDALRCMVPAKIVFKRKTKSLQSQADSAVPAAETTLNTQQTEALEKMLPLLRAEAPKAALLYGITGSGKTMVYIKLIDETLKLGKTAIVLVPEISLTPQTVRIFNLHFGDNVAVLHSRLSAGEKYNEWKRIRDGSVSVVVGTRSAVFAPVRNIGLIVIDEEQEHTYKSENSPRYHAREIAKYRVTQSSGLLLLASATPSVESMYAAKNGSYTLLRLDSRYNEKDLPPVIIADMRKELRAGNGGQISSVLRDELALNIKNNEQSILFINRRGANSAVVCPQCGYTCNCRNCSVSMTYHISNKRLLCHYCGYSVAVPAKCPECECKLKYIGTGTQRIEQEIAALFPGAGIIRMDADTTTQKNAHHKLLREFQTKKIPILLGTQMVTKGLDFENVTLVGVLNADLSLYVSDYRANERTFSLITQVVGRSGRGEKPGRAVIQTFTPENNVIKLSSMQDYDSFYDSEIKLRDALGCPPVRDLLSLTVTGTSESSVIYACDVVKSMLDYYFNKASSIRLLGPAPAPISKIKNKYVYKLMINCKNSKKIRETIGHVIREFMKGKKSRGVTVYADVEI